MKRASGSKPDWENRSEWSLNVPLRLSIFIKNYIQSAPLPLTTQVSLGAAERVPNGGENRRELLVVIIGKRSAGR